jgi:eukaryotic-like serine/threonine-protein kinase
MVGEVVAHRYELERVLGTGGMATVFCAFDTVLERKVALKILHEQFAADEDYVARFENEARAAARLTHPNIVTVIDRGAQDGRRFIVFEHVEGETLKQLARREGPLPIELVLRLGADVARGLAFAHTNGIVHRDIKPQNVLVDDHGRAKVTDFGIARTGTATGHTETGTILGTGSYISPEQARGERAGPASDVYALGAVLHELLTGRPPYDGPSLVAVAMSHVRDPVPDVAAERPDCPPELAALVERCLAKDAGDRPSATDVAGELAAIAHGPDHEASPEERTFVISRRTPGRRRRRTGRRLWIVAVAVLLTAGAAVAALLVAGGDDRAASGDPVGLEAVSTFDPVGGDGENDGDIALATDGDPTTSWSTEGYYDDFESQKDGVGLVVDAGATRGLSSLTVTTDLPGWTAEIRAGGSETSFSSDAAVGEARTTRATTTWELDGEPARYYLIWITAMTADDEGTERAHVNEVTARS